MSCWSRTCTSSRWWSGRTSPSARRPRATSTCCARPGERFGFAVEGMSLVAEHHQDETVTFSSTYIRSCVDAGDVVAAAEALGRPHRVEGVVVRGDGRGKVLGFPTANVAPPMYSAIPADGVYAAWFTVLGHGPVMGTVVPGERYQAAVSVGTNPDVLRAHPHRRGVRPRHRRRPVRTARRGGLRRPHPRPGAVRHVDGRPGHGDGRRHRAGPHHPAPSAQLQPLLDFLPTQRVLQFAVAALSGA